MDNTTLGLIIVALFVILCVALQVTLFVTRREVFYEMWRANFRDFAETLFGSPVRREVPAEIVEPYEKPKRKDIGRPQRPYGEEDISDFGVDLPYADDYVNIRPFAQMHRDYLGLDHDTLEDEQYIERRDNERQITMEQWRDEKRKNGD
jgi:hypothetical protein